MYCFFRFRWWPFSLEGKEALILRARERRISQEGLMTCHREGQKVPPHNPGQIPSVESIQHVKVLDFGVAIPGPHHCNAFLSTSVNTREGTSRVPSRKPSNKTHSASIATYTLLEGRPPKLGNCLREHSKKGPQPSPECSITLVQLAPGSIWPLWFSPVSPQTIPHSRS